MNLQKKEKYATYIFIFNRLVIHFLCVEKEERVGRENDGNISHRSK